MAGIAWRLRNGVAVRSTPPVGQWFGEFRCEVAGRERHRRYAELVSHYLEPGSTRFHFSSLWPVDRVEQPLKTPGDWCMGICLILGFQTALYFA